MKKEVTEYYPERRKKMPSADVTNKPTVIRLELWGVLILIALCIGHLYVGLAATKETAQIDKQAISERVVRVEMSVIQIVAGIEELKKSQKEMMDILVKQKRVRGE